MVVPPLRYLVADVLRCHPRLYLPLARRFNRAIDGSDRTVSRDTDLVIEAYPRSGNTFARFAFELAQGRPVKLAHHLHAPAQVIAAAWLNVPALVIIRDPADAALSLHIRTPRLSLATCLASYRRFYRTVEPYRQSFVLARFETVTRDFGRVIEAVNARYNTRFVPFIHDAEHEAEVFARMEANHLRTRPTDRIAEQTISRPAALKEAYKQKLRQTLDSAALAGLHAQARQVYERLVATADV